MEQQVNSDPRFLTTALILNTDRFDMYMARARDYRDGLGDDEDVQWALGNAKDVSDRIRELKRRQRSAVIVKSTWEEQSNAPYPAREEECNWPEQL